MIGEEGDDIIREWCSPNLKSDQFSLSQQFCNDKAGAHTTKTLKKQDTKFLNNKLGKQWIAPKKA